MPTPRTLRVALLLCDTPNPYVLAEEGTYLDVFRTHLLSSISAAGRSEEINLEIEGFDVVNEGKWPEEKGLEKGGWDGVMITGSGEYRAGKRGGGRELELTGVDPDEQRIARTMTRRTRGFPRRSSS